MISSLPERAVRLGQRVHFAQLGLVWKTEIAWPRLAPTAHDGVIRADVADTCREWVVHQNGVEVDRASATSRQGSPSTSPP